MVVLNLTPYILLCFMLVGGCFMLAGGNLGTQSVGSIVYIGLYIVVVCVDCGVWCEVWCVVCGVWCMVWYGAVWRCVVVW